jgi:hypothetical protein
MPVSVNFCLSDVNAVDEAVLASGEQVGISPEVLAIHEVSPRAKGAENATKDIAQNAIRASKGG